MDLRTLRVRSFAAATGLLWFSGVAMYGAMLLLPLYYQRERGFSALAAGLLLAPQGIGSLLPRTIAGRAPGAPAPGPRRRQPSRSSRSPRMTKSGRRGGSAASCMSGRERRSASSVAATSTRASGAPRQ